MKEQALKTLKESALQCSFCAGFTCDTQENLEACREQCAHGQSRARTDVGSVREEQGGVPASLCCSVPAAWHPGLSLKDLSVPAPVLPLSSFWN